MSGVPCSSTAVSDGTIAATLTPAHVEVAQLGQRAARAVAPRRGGVVLEALGRRHHHLVRHARARDDVAVAVGRDRLDRRRPDVDADRHLGAHAPLPRRAQVARERGHHVVVQQPVGRDHVAGVDARVAAHVGAPAAGLLDHHLHRGDVPHREPADLDRDVDRAVGHQHVRPEVAEAAHAPAAPRQREELRVEADRLERVDRVVREVRVLDAADLRHRHRRRRRAARRSPRAPDQRDPSAGADTTPATRSPSTSSAMSVAHTGMPRA